MRISLFPSLVVAAMAATISAAELHVTMDGDDTNLGTDTAPLRTIQRAAELAKPGDVITVHAGTYRERINPPRGGDSDTQRIVYQAAPGEVVEIKGSEVVRDWVKVQDNVWKVTLPNSLFGDFNPYSDLIHGDWFERKGRDHHTGAVYLHGDWLTEAVTLDEVLMPAGTAPAWLGQTSQQYLLNVAWLRLGDGAESAGAFPPRVSRPNMARKTRPVPRVTSASVLSSRATGCATSRSTVARKPSRSRFERLPPRKAGSSRFASIGPTANCWEPVPFPPRAIGNCGDHSRPRSRRSAASRPCAWCSRSPNRRP